MNKQQKTEMYLAYLRRRGYNPELDEDGDINFKKEGGIYLIFPDDTDDEYFSIVYPNFWKVESDAERTRALTACNLAIRVSKVVKVFLRQDSKNIWAAVEVFVVKPENFEEVFDRLMSALRNGVTTFADEMKKSSQLAPKKD